jgi:hypothetical protein
MASCSFTVTVRCGSHVPSDCNADGTLDLSDGICLLGHLFLGKPSRLPCATDGPSRGASRALFDPNNDRAVDLYDAVHLLSFLFTGGPPPALGRSCLTLPGCEKTCGAAE